MRKEGVNLLSQLLGVRLLSGNWRSSRPAYPSLGGEEQVLFDAYFIAKCGDARMSRSGWRGACSDLKREIARLLAGRGWWRTCRIA